MSFVYRRRGALEDLPPYAKLDGYKIVATYDFASLGRTGVAILSRHPITDKSTHLCEHANCSGRFIEATIGSLKIVSAYAHAHDSKNKERWQHRRQFNECLGSYIRHNADTACLIALDANVALTPDDAASPSRWKGPWADGSKGAYRKPIYDAMQEAGWADSFRVIHGKERRATVWTPMNFAPENGVEAGYGIDFQLISPPLITKTRTARVFKPASWAERFSDHAPTLGIYEIGPAMST